MQYGRDSLLSNSAKKSRLVPAAFHPHPQGPPPCGMTPVYDNYINFSIDSSQTINGPHTIYSTAVVEGYTTVNGYCASLHHGTVYNNIDSDQNPFQTGPNVTPPTYISVSNSDSATGSPGQVFNNVYSVVITCSTAGAFFYNWNVTFAAEIAVTTAQVVGGGPGAWQLGPFPNYWCNLVPPQYLPPDFQPFVYAGRETTVNYTLGDAVCISSNALSHGWHCSPGPAIVIVGQIEKQFCTANTPAY